MGAGLPAQEQITCDTSVSAKTVPGSLGATDLGRRLTDQNRGSQRKRPHMRSTPINLKHSHLTQRMSRL
jgi:hypothetical protein